MVFHPQTKSGIIKLLLIKHIDMSYITITKEHAIQNPAYKPFVGKTVTGKEYLAFGRSTVEVEKVEKVEKVPKTKKGKK